MQDNMEKRDLRVVKTTNILKEAMFSLLNRQSFRKITVRDICEEAQISRATFYARYSDKYDFLKNWLINLIPEGIDQAKSYLELEKIHNENFYKNKLVIKDLILDADSETLEILADFLLTYFMLDDKYDIKRMTTEQVTLSSFFTGGMLFYILWHVKNKFPVEILPMNVHLYKLLIKFRDWEIDTI